MKILMMCHFPLTGSGSGVYTLNVAHALTKLGHEVHIIVPENQEPEQYDDFEVHPVYFNGCNEEALPINFPCFTTHPRSMQTFYDLTDEELKAYETAFRKAIEEEIETFQPDVIHCGHAWLQPSYAADYDVPLVITVHGTDIIGYEKANDFFREHAAHAMNAAGGIVTISKENNNLVRNIFPDEFDKCTLILNGYNADVFYPEKIDREEVLRSFGIEGDFKKVVSFAGKFAHFKGIDVLLRGAAEFMDDDTVLILAGDGELFDKMNELAEELGLKNVHFVHNQPHDALRKLYSIADVSLLTSRKEPFGLVIIEAMACGTPIVGSNDGGAVDILNENVGLLFESENPTDLAEKVRKVLDGDVAFDRDEVAEYAKSNFSLDTSIGKLVEVYEKAMNA